MSFAYMKKNICKTDKITYSDALLLQAFCRCWCTNTWRQHHTSLHLCHMRYNIINGTSYRRSRESNESHAYDNNNISAYTVQNRWKRCKTAMQTTGSTNCSNISYNHHTHVNNSSNQLSRKYKQREEYIQCGIRETIHAMHEIHENKYSWRSYHANHLNR